MTKIINKSVIMLYDITLLMFIGIIRNIFVLYYYTTAFKNALNVYMIFTIMFDNPTFPPVSQCDPV